MNPAVKGRAPARLADDDDDDEIKVYDPPAGKTSAAGNRPGPGGPPTRVMELNKSAFSSQLFLDDEDEQLFFEEFLTDEAENAADPGWEERFRDSRREKAEQFRVKRPVQPAAASEDNAAASAAAPRTKRETVSADREIEDYGDYSQTSMVRRELNYRRRTSAVALTATFLLELTLAGLSVITAGQISPRYFLLLHIGLLALMMIIQHRVFSRSFSVMARGTAAAEGTAALLAFAVLLHTVLQLFFTSGSGIVTVYTPAAGLGLLFCAFGKQWEINRISRNFKTVSEPGDKYTAEPIHEDMAEQIMRPDRDGVFQLAFFRPAGFLDGFLANSYDEDIRDPEGYSAAHNIGKSIWYSLTIAVLAGILCIVLGVAQGSGALFQAFTTGLCVLCLSLPLFSLAGTRWLIGGAARRSRNAGGLLAGWKSAAVYGDVSGAVLDAADFYPKEAMMLHGIKTFSGSRIDSVILDAAAVAIGAGGPLSHVFRRIIEDRTDMLEKVDTLIYEQDMGLSGWVGGRRVLVGNRILLQNHGVDVPSKTYEEKYRRDRRQLVYLSVGGELSAMFVVSYLADPGIARILRDMSGAGVTLLVRTCDPNITAATLTRDFDLEEDAVQMLDTAAGKIYEKLANETFEESPALVASDGKFEGMATALTSCVRLRRSLSRQRGVQTVTGVVGALFGAYYMLIYGGIFTPLLLTGLTLLAAAVVWASVIVGRK